MELILVVENNNKAGLVAAILSSQLDHSGIECVVATEDTPVDIVEENTFEFELLTPNPEDLEIFHEKIPRRGGQKSNRWRK